jgi:hypothetical protein
MNRAIDGFATFAFLLLITAGIPTYVVVCVLGWF